ncbi:MAG: hypothetical protein EOM61_10195, partial [Bacteroidia bacterium]|nr:hypothetical protein [Bacteroidia bacterium]
MVFNWLSQQVRNVLSPVVQAGYATRQAVLPHVSPISGGAQYFGANKGFNKGFVITTKPPIVKSPPNLKPTPPKPTVSMSVETKHTSEWPDPGVSTVSRPLTHAEKFKISGPITAAKASPQESTTPQFSVISPKDYYKAGLVHPYQPTFEDRAREKGGWFYRTMDDIAKGYEQHIGKPYEHDIAPKLQRVHENIINPILSVPVVGTIARGALGPVITNPSLVSGFGKGVVSDTVPGIARFAGMIPGGATHLAKSMTTNPAVAVPVFAGFAAQGLKMQGEGIYEGLKNDPGRLAGSLVGTALLTRGVMKAPGLAYRGAVRGGTYV